MGAPRTQDEYVYRPLRAQPCPCEECNYVKASGAAAMVAMVVIWSLLFGFALSHC